METLHNLNPFGKRETHSQRTLVTYKVLTIVSWLLVVVTSILHSSYAPEDGHRSHNRTIWGQNRHHPTPFSLNPFVTDIYWIVLLVLQVGYVWHLFSTNTTYVTAAANVGSHFIFNNILQFAFILLWVRGLFWVGELMLVLNFLNLTVLYFRHPTSPNFIHAPAVSWPLAWTFVALFWNGAAMVGAHHTPARIVANVFIWTWLLYGLFFVLAFKDWTLGSALSLLTLSLAVHQFHLKIVALQWIFGFTIFGTLFLFSLLIAVPGFFGKELGFGRSQGTAVSDDRERAPLLADQ